MKIFALLIACLLAGTEANGMVYSDSRVVTPQQLADEGIIVDIRLTGKSEIQVFASIQVMALGKKYRGMAYSVLDKPIDADFGSAEPLKSGIRDSRRWAKEVRGSSTEKKIMNFTVSDDEVRYTYIVFQVNLPPKDDIPVFGHYYVVLSDIPQKANQAPEPTSPVRGSDQH